MKSRPNGLYDDTGLERDPVDRNCSAGGRTYVEELVGDLARAVDARRLKRSLLLLFGFLVGCVVAAAAISLLGDRAWSFPATLAAVAIALR